MNKILLISILSLLALANSILAASEAEVVTKEKKLNQIEHIVHSSFSGNCHFDLMAA